MTVDEAVGTLFTEGMKAGLEKGGTGMACKPTKGGKKGTRKPKGK